MFFALNRIQLLHENLKYHIGDPASPSLTLGWNQIQDCLLSSAEDLRLAVQCGDHIKATTALAQIQHTALSAAVAWGLPIDTAFDALWDQRSHREDESTLKPAIENAQKELLSDIAEFGYGPDGAWPVPTRGAGTDAP